MKGRWLLLLWGCLVLFGGVGCAALSAVGPAVSLGVVGVHYLANSKVERTFFSPWPEVREAARQALRQWEIPVEEEVVEQDHVEFRAAVPDLRITLTLSALTPRTTKVSVKAGSGLFRDRATAEAILTQVAGNLALSPPSPSAVSPRHGPWGGLVPASGTLPSALNGGNIVPVVFPPAEASSALSLRSPIPEGGDDRKSSPIPRTPGRNSEPDGIQALNPEPRTVNAEPLEPGEPNELLYRQAVEAYTKGESERAIEGFQQVIRRCPGDDRCPSAYYLLGESYALQKDYLQAILAFEMVIREYPSSQEVPRALYREVLIYHTIRQPRLAKAALKKLLTSFPHSREARLLRPRPKGG